MKVLLTSTGLENEKIRDVFLTNIEKNPRFCKALFVTCAAIDQESKDMVKECYKELLDLHIRPNSIIEYNFDSKMSVDELCQYDLMYVCGGDENHLIKKIIDGKMRLNLIESVRRSLFYIGVSAGACVGSPYVQDGLNFCPNKVDVHCTKNVTPNGKLPPQNTQINLSDGQAVWIKDDTMTIIGTDTSHQSGSDNENVQIENVLNRFPNYFKYIEEAKLSTDERRCFGLPKKKKYPMPDEAHVRAAIRFFNHCDPEDEEELARNINKYIRKYNMKNINVGDNNRFKKYYKPVEDSKAVGEDYIRLPFLPDHGDGTVAIPTKVVNELANVRKSSNEELLEIANFIDLIVDSSKRTLKILESGGGCIVGMDINNVTVQNYSPGMFIIQYNTEDEKKAYAVSNDIKTKYIYREKDHKLVRENYEWLNNKTYKIYKVDISCMDKWKDLLLKVLHNKQITSIYEELTGKRMLNEHQFNLDDRFKEVLID